MVFKSETFTGQAETFNSVTITGPALMQNPVTANSGVAYTIDQNNGAQFDITLNASSPTLTLQSVTSGEAQVIYVTLIQDSTGSRSVIWQNTTWKSGVVPTLNTASGARNYFVFNSDGVSWVGDDVAQATGAGPAVLQNAPTINTPNMVGVVDGSTALTGSIGEILTASRASGSATPLSNATIADVTSISLTAGDWNLFGVIAFSGGAVTGTIFQGFFGTTTGDSSAGRDTAYNTVSTPTSPTATEDVIIAMPVYTVNIPATTIYYLKANATFSIGNATAYGSISARRIR